MERDVEHRHAAQRHRDGQRDGRGHDQRGPPVHEEQRHEHHHHDGFNETLHEMSDAAGHRAGLVRKLEDVHAVRQARLELIHHRHDLAVEAANDVAFFHFDREQNGTMRVQRTED